MEQIKNAIYSYGPVTVAICVGGYFKLYTGGVYNFEYICIPGIVNHGVVLYGWDDNYEWEGNTYGVWFLRNSWGTDWGENGYMNIEYDCCKVGYRAVYIDYQNRFTVRCVNESDEGGPGTSPGVVGIKNCWVKLESTDGQVYKTGYT